MGNLAPVPKIKYNRRQMVRISRKTLFVCFLAAAVLIGGNCNRALAEGSKTGYAATTFRDLAQTAVGMGGLDISNPQVMDDYAELVLCDYYKKFYRNDFEWNKIRQTIQGIFMEQKGGFRTLYEFGGPVFLDRYDFKTQAFPLAEESAEKNVGRMVMFYKRDFVPYCDRWQPSVNFPQYFMINLRTPVNLERIYMNQKDADAFIKRMQENGNSDRVVYVRFRVKVLAAVGLDGLGTDRNFTFEGSIEDIDFFEDKDYTTYIASGR